MLRTFAIFAFILFPCVAFAGGEEVTSGLKNGSNNPDDPTTTTVSDGSINRNNTRESLPSVWVADMFYRALTNFTIREDVGTAECRKQTETYVRHLRNNSYWAVKMYDSWSRYPNGILTGSTHQMGVYDECIDVHQPVQGKYCMTAVKLSAAANSSFELRIKDEVDSFDHAWNEILAFIYHQDQYRRNEVKIGICIPESCTAENLEISLQNALDNIFLPHHVQPRVKVEPILCTTDKDAYPYDTGYYVTMTIMYLVLTICVVSTLIHLIVITRNKDIGEKSNIPDCAYWFSIIHNGRNLIKYNKNSDLNIFNGVKVLVISWIVFGHNLIYYIMTPVSYTMNIEEIFKVGPVMVLTSMNLVDPFFYISGFLLYTSVKPQFVKSGSSWITVPVTFVFKYLRCLPAHGAMILLTIYFIPHINVGPFWASKTWPEAEKCKNYWWANLLAMSNFIDVNNQCLVVGWYISCLMQFLVIGITVVYIYVKNRKLGVIVISLLLCVSLIVPFYMTYTARAYGIIRLVMPFLEKMGNSYEFQHLYGPFYIRGIPFYVGLLAGILVEDLKKRKFKMSRLAVYTWTAIVTTVCMLIQNYSFVFYQRHRPYNVIEQATFATLSHCTWTTLLFCMTICHFTSGYGPIERVFNNRLTTILSRLGYAMYLVNITVVMTIANRQAASVIPSTDEFVDGFLVGALKSYGTALLLHLFVEAPFNTIIKTIFFGKKNNATKENHPKFTEIRDCPTENVQHVSAYSLDERFPTVDPQTTGDSKACHK